jgi:carbamoyl-phosphate synthase large subunit
MPRRDDIHRILLIGSGPIVIGQACEFDYSGNQAVRALKEEGYEVMLVNPNPATFMTSHGIADRIYMEPLEPAYIEAILEAERPDALLPTMGGQTALNLALDLTKAGILEKYRVELIGAGVEAIELAEDRGKFKETAAKIGLDSPQSGFIHTVAEAKEFRYQFGFPLIIRPSYTLGGKGGSIAYNEAELDDLVQWALDESPVNTALIEESLIGWKEFELEVVRDKADNAVVVCSIENVDPMGVHTGDSITVAPIQTLSDREYQRMRSAAIEVLRAVGVDCGGSNVQFAMDPESDRMVVIEMNPRVSRSSALASKATGFPIARCAARLAVGYTLDEIPNDITKTTVACFEPALDYCAVKVPRFELEKFPSGYKELGTQMKSVGESLSLGRSFEEALNKAIRAGEFGFEGLEELAGLGEDELEDMLIHQHPRRLFAAYTLLVRRGRAAIPDICRKSGFDPWFLERLAGQAAIEASLQAGADSARLLLRAKMAGLSDRRIAALSGRPAAQITSVRTDHGIHAAYHMVDTCAGEFEASTPYFYSTYGEEDEGAPFGEAGVLIVGSGPNRIGQGLEFDTCCTLASRAYRTHGVQTIMVNSNPETVSTDFNVSDRLYLEPVNAEEVKEVLRKEGVRDVVVQLGGQTALNMAEELEQAGARIVGTPVGNIRNAEDRGLFSDLLGRLGIRQAENRMAGSHEAVEAAAEELGYPVLLRPSYVLGGRNMSIAYGPEELREFLRREAFVSEARPVLVDQFLEDAFEYDLDALADGEDVYVGGIIQHIEAAGVHSGDSAGIFPPYKAEPAHITQMLEAARAISREFGIQGFLNIQFAVKEGEVYVIEVNPRASRTVPFLSKASGIELVDLAVNLWRGQSLRSQGVIDRYPTDVAGVGMGGCITGWAVKEAVFSFDRFRETDPMLGPEMKSTGEVIGIGESFGEAFSKATSATGSELPASGSVFISVHDADKGTLLPVVRELDRLGFHIVATRGTAQFLFKNGIFPEVVLKVHEGHPNVIDHLQHGKIDLVINTPLGRFTQRDDDRIRIEAVRCHVPYTTTTSAAEAALEGIKHRMEQRIVVRPLPMRAHAAPQPGS